MLMSECKATTRLALAVALGALPANRLLLVTLELPLTASHAIRRLAMCKYSSWRVRTSQCVTAYYSNADKEILLQE